MFCSRIIAILAAGTLLAPLASAAFAQDITVTAPRSGKRSSTTGAPIETVTRTVTVSAAGLDLSTAAGQQQAEMRVRAAAVSACRWLDEHYQLVDDNSDCVKDATDEAMARVRGGNNG